MANFWNYSMPTEYAVKIFHIYWVCGKKNFYMYRVTQQRSNILRCFFHTRVCIPFLLLTAVANCAHLLSTCLAGENGTLYSEAEPIKGAETSRQPSVDCTPFYRQHLCRGQCVQEQSRPQQHAWNSNLFVVFLAEITTAQSPHFQHLM
jgi:hypothetical protein